MLNDNDSEYFKILIKSNSTSRLGKTEIEENMGLSSFTLVNVLLVVFVINLMPHATSAECVPNTCIQQLCSEESFDLNCPKSDPYDTCQQSCTGGNCSLSCHASEKCDMSCTAGSCKPVVCTAKTCDMSCTGGGCEMEC